MYDPKVDLGTLSKGMHARTTLGAPATLSGQTPALADRQSAVPLPPSRWKTRILLPLVIVLSFAGVLLYALRDSLLPARRVTVVPVVVKSAGGGGASGVVAQAAGWVEPDPYPIYVSALTDGIVKEISVLEGQTVKAGQVVARLIDDDAKLELELAEAEYQHHLHDVCDYKAGVAAAQAEWDHPVERQRAIAVASAQLAQSRAELIENDRQRLVEVAKVAELKEQFQRENAAAEDHAFPKLQAALTGLKLETQQAMVGATDAKKPALAAKVAAQEAEVAAVQENLKLRISETRAVDETAAKLAAELHTVETIRVKRDMAKLKLARTEIRSPADGVVMERMTEPGAKLYVNMNERNSAQALKLYNPEKLQVRVDVPLADAAKVGIGQKARIVVEVLRDVVFEGTVSRVLHEADVSKNTLQVKVAIQAPRAELRPEMLARVQFLAIEQTAGKEQEPRERVFARENLIHNVNGMTHVWLWDKGHNLAIERMVTLGHAKQDGWIEITDGLLPGDALIEGDTANLKSGQRVSVSQDEAPAAAADAHGEHKMN